MFDKMIAVPNFRAEVSYPVLDQSTNKYETRRHAVKVVGMLESNGVLRYVAMAPDEHGRLYAETYDSVIAELPN